MRVSAGGMAMPTCDMCMYMHMHMHMHMVHMHMHVHMHVHMRMRISQVVRDHSRLGRGTRMRI